MALEESKEIREKRKKLICQKFISIGMSDGQALSSWAYRDNDDIVFFNCLDEIYDRELVMDVLQKYFEEVNIPYK